MERGYQDKGHECYHQTLKQAHYLVYPQSLDLLLGDCLSYVQIIVIDLEEDKKIMLKDADRRSHLYLDLLNLFLRTNYRLVSLIHSIKESFS